MALWNPEIYVENFARPVDSGFLDGAQLVVGGAQSGT